MSCIKDPLKGAMGGSTNAMIHLIAIAGRAGIKLNLKRFDKISRQTPVLANIKPSGTYLMEDFYYAGGLRALIGRLGDRLDLSQGTVTGKTSMVRKAIILVVFFNTVRNIFIIESLKC